MRRKIKKIRKRDGRTVDFKQEKITNAIFKAMLAVGEKDRKLAKKLSKEVVEILEKRFDKKKIPSVEEIQDIVEEVLIRNKLSKVAKAYILYRKKRAEIRKFKRMLGVKDDLKLSINAIQVLKARYLLRDGRGRILETPKKMFQRVAKIVSRENKEKEKEFFNVMSKLEFLPNSPTLMNAGTRIGQLSACFVLPVEDSIEGIFEAVKNMAIIHKSGGGCIIRGSRVFSNFCGSENIEKIYEHFEKNKNKYRVANASFIDISEENLMVPSFDKRSGKVSFRKVTYIWKYLVPSEKTLRITCENGYTAEVSEWHPFFVFENGEIKEKRADELKPGDFLIISNPTIMNSWPFTYQQINGITLDEKLAWVVGIFLTDGAISKTKNGLRVRFFSTDKKIIDTLLKIIEDKTQKKYGVYKDKRSIKPLMIISVYDKTFTETMKLLNRGIVGRKDNICRIPEQIFKSPVSTIGAFLAGIMDGDGYVSNSKAQIEISTASKDFAEDLSSLLYLFGIKSRYRVRKDKRNKKWLEMYEIAISGEINLKRFAQLVMPFMVSTEKIKRLKKHSSLKYSSSPVSIDFKIIEPYLMEAGINTRNTEIWRRSIKVGNKKFFLARWKEKNKVNTSKVVLLIEELLKLNLSKESKKKLKLLLNIIPNLIKIKEVVRNDSGEILEFYDFTVEDTNNYLAGNKGLCFIHNTGFSFSRLRPKGDIVKSTMGIASGPVSFMKVFDITTEVIKQGGKRRGANMGILRVDHPDIVEFITAKEKEGMLRNFNISVGVTDSFMRAVEENEDYYLINPRNKKKVKKINAGDIFDLIASMAWRTGDPGLIFLDEINRHNPTPSIGEIESTNPCGEVPLLPYESCNLGSINLAKVVEGGRVNWKKLASLVSTGVEFLDNVIDANKYPLKEIEKMTKSNRKIGLGVMGFAEALIKLRIPYASRRAIEFAEKLMKFISEHARKKSEELGEEKGSFPNFDKSIFADRYKAMRNATVTSIAPTGSISIIADTTSGIEPIFAVVYLREILEGTRLVEVNQLFENIAIERGFYSEELMEKVAKYGSVQGIKEIPEDVKELFKTALEISPEQHVRIQAAFQRYVDNAVAKTVNLPYEATIEDVRKVFLLAHKLKCKGITVYRYGSKEEQVLYLGTEKTCRRETCII